MSYRFIALMILFGFALGALRSIMNAVRLSPDSTGGHFGSRPHKSHS